MSAGDVLVKAGGEGGLDDLDRWFMTEVLACEPMLMRYLRRNCGTLAEPEDLRQEIYTQVYDAARVSRPVHVSAFVRTVARNLLISHARRAKIVHIEQSGEIDDFGVDAVTPERNALARDELRRVEEGLGNLPPRCREVILLRKVKGLSQKQVAREMNIGIDTVERQTALGMRALIDFMSGGDGRIKRPPARLRLVARGGGDEPA